MPGANQYRAAQFIEKIPGTGGIVSTIAKRVGCSWHTAKKYIDNYATIRRAYDDECESILDLAEAKTIGLIKDGDGPMIRYYLSTKGARRGYVTRTEQAIVGSLLFKVEETDTWRGKQGLGDNSPNDNRAPVAPGPEGDLPPPG